jgi:hypothetical protein
VHKINEALETKQYCSAAFLDISQAFDRVWHTWLLHKLRQLLPLNYYHILNSYLHNRHFQVKVEDSYTDLLPVNAGVPQGSVCGPLLYLLYTADLPASPDATIATFADDTAILATDPDPAIASQKLLTCLLAIQHWLTKWRLKANSSKSTHVTFTTRRATCPGVHIYNVQIPRAEEVKYLGLHLDRRLTWHLKPIWTYGIQLWGSASISNIEILQRFQGKVLRMITDATWYVPNTVLRQDLQITSAKQEIYRFSTQHRDRLYTHPNNLTVYLTVPPDHRRLRHLPIDLPTRFIV